MSTEIDSKVVEMRFDNKQFEANVAMSMSTIEKLKQSLNLTGASKGLENVSDAAKNCNVSSLGTAVETIQAHFSSFEVAAVTALANITNSAVNCGKRMVAALTIDSKKQGFEEYELKMNSIQTIMMSTGASLEDVNKYLNELNTYADRTIYSFSDMTSNIGKFTNAGVKLEDAVMAIQGVSNAAAVSGANSNEASRAMYNFAQALSAGYVKLIDWKSIENANMATVEFKTQLLESAVACGTLTKTTDGMYKTVKGNVIDATRGFNESLQDQWMTTEALVGTLRDYADETTEIGKKAFAAAQDVKTFTQLWDTLKEAAGSGWAMTWEILIGDFEEAKATLTEVSNVMGNIIGESANARNELLQGWKDLGGRIVLLESFKNIFDAILSVVKPIKEAFRDIFPATTAQQLLSFTEGFRNLTSHLILSDSAAENLKNVFKGLFSVVKVIVNILSGFVQGATKLVGAILPIGDGVLSVSGSLGEFVSKINEAISGTNIFGSIFETLANIITPAAELIKNALNGIATGVDKLGGLTGVLKKVASGIGTVFDKIKTVVSNAMGNLGFDSLPDAVNGGLLAGILLGIKKFIKSLTDLTTNGPGIVNGIKDILDGVSGSLEAFQSQIKAGTLLKIASALGILAASLFVISAIDEGKMTSSLGAVTGLFIELFGSMAAFEKIMGGSGFKSMGKVSRAMIGVSAAVLILSAAMKKLASLSWSEILRGLTATAIGLGVLIGAIYLLPKDTNAKTGSLIGLLVALVILSGALKVMGSMSWEEVGRGLVTLAGSLAILIGSMHLMKSAVAGAMALPVISSALIILSGALKVMGSMSWEEIGRGLVTLAGSLTIITVAMKFMTSALPGAAALLVVFAALAVLTPVMLALGSMSWEGIAKGLVSIAGAFAVIGVAGSLLGPISPLILALGGAVALLGAGCLAAGVGLLAFSTALSALAISGTAGGAALVAVIQSLIALIPSLAVAIGVGIVAMAATIGANAVTVITAFTQILTAMLQAIIDVAPKLAETIVTVLTSLLDAVIEVTPKFAEAVATILASILDVIAETVPKIVETVVTCLEAVLQGIVEFVPQMVVAGLQIITGLLQGIADNISGVVESGVNIIVNFLEAIGNELPRVVDAGFNMMINFINGLADSINTNTPILTAAINNLMNAVINAGKTFITESARNIAGIGENLVNGIKKGISNKVESLKHSIKDLGTNMVSWFKEVLGIHSPSVVFEEEVGRYIVQGIAEGIKNDMSAEEAAEKKADNIVNAFRKELDKYDLGISNRSKDFELWQLEDGKAASTVEILQKQKEKLSEDLVDYNKQVQLNTDKWQQLKDTVGENSKETKEAYGAMRDSQIEAAKIAEEYISIDKSIIDAQEECLDGWKTMNENDLEIMKSEQANGKIYPDGYVDERYLAVYKDNLDIAMKKEDNAEKYFYETLSEYKDKNHPVVQAALQAWQDSMKERLQAVATINDYNDSVFERELQTVEDSRSHRQDVIKRWEAEYGDKANAYQSKLFYTNIYTSELDDLNREYAIQNDKYNTLVEKIAEENGISKEEAKQTKKAVDFLNNELYPLETEKIELQNKIDNVDKDYLEQQKENLKDRYETASDIADIKYQIWELTTGRDATDTEKETMKLAVLTEQLGNQAKLVNMAEEAWKNAKEDEKLEKETEYWNARLELAQLQSDVLDIQESVTKRQKSALDKQRLAQDEYEDYVKQYEKYYLDHGMTLNDLERDAKLISGYDPDKVTNTAINKTQSAIDNVKANITNLTAAVAEGIQNGVTDITVSTTSMLDSCADVLSSEKTTWFEAGANMAEKLADGIRSKIETIVDTVTELVYSSFEAMNAVLENGVGYSSGISVIGGQNLVSDTTLSSIRSLESTSYNLAKSIAQRYSDGNSDTSAVTQPQPVTYTFTQNNYSPKSLSAAEIYRQTNNMVSRLGKRVNT